MIITLEDVTSAFIKALTSKSSVTSLLNNGSSSIGTGALPVTEGLPYILVNCIGVVYIRGGGRCLHSAVSRVNVSVYAEQSPNTVAESTVRSIHKASIEVLATEGNVAISGCSVQPPEFSKMHMPEYDIVSGNRVIYWSTQWWDVMIANS